LPPPPALRRVLWFEDLDGLAARDGVWVGFRILGCAVSSCADAASAAESAERRPPSGRLFSTSMARTPLTASETGRRSKVGRRHRRGREDRFVGSRR